MNQPSITQYPPGTTVVVGTHTVKIVKYLTSGGFAQIYATEIIPRNVYSGSNFACLKRVIVPDKASLNSLRAEVEAMKLLKNNKHVVSYIDSHAARSHFGNGTYEVFVLMEYCERGGLIDFMNTRLQNRLQEHEILNIMSNTCMGIAAMHKLQPPLLHRDIKIENVLISGSGEYKICDFGSVCGVIRPPRNKDELAFVQHDIMKNTTAQYRSPEMIDLYRGLAVDEKSDIWALGVFLYKLCYYTTPFEKAGEAAILHSRYQYPAYPQYSDKLKNLIRVLLSQQPVQRPNICQVLEEISRIQGIPCPIKNFYLQRAMTNANLTVHSLAIPKETQTPADIISLKNTGSLTEPVSNLTFNSKHNLSKSATNTNNLMTQAIKLSPTLSQSQLSKRNVFYEPKKMEQNEERNSLLYSPQKTARYLSQSPIRKNNYIDSETQTFDFETFGRHLSRSTSIKSNSSYNFESGLKENGTGDSMVRRLSNQLKKVITGESFTASPIKSRNNTGDSIRSAIGVLRNGLTGGNVRSTSAENPRRYTPYSSQKGPNITVNQIQEEELYDDDNDIWTNRPKHKVSGRSLSDFDDFERKTSLTDPTSYYKAHSPIKMNVNKEMKESIQRRVQDLLRSAEDQNVRKTASGYGKYTDEETRQDHIIQGNGYKSDKVNSHVSDTPNSHRKSSVIIRRISVPSNTNRKAKPPVPSKPKALSNVLISTNTHLSSDLNNTRVSSLNTEAIIDFNVDDLEADFKKRFPSAAGL